MPLIINQSSTLGSWPNQAHMGHRWKISELGSSWRTHQAHVGPYVKDFEMGHINQAQEIPDEKIF